MKGRKLGRGLTYFFKGYFFFDYLLEGGPFFEESGDFLVRGEFLLGGGGGWLRWWRVHFLFMCYDLLYGYYVILGMIRRGVYILMKYNIY